MDTCICTALYGDSQNEEVNDASAAGSYYTQLLAIINRSKCIISNHFLTNNSRHHMIRKQVHKRNLDATEKMKNKFSNAKRLKLKILKFQYQTDELERHAVIVVSVDGWENDMVISLREALQKFNRRRDDVYCASISLVATTKNADATKIT